MFNLRSIKTQLIIFLACFAVFLSVKSGNAVFLLTTAVAVISAVAADSMIGYIRTKAFQIAESAVITGFIIGYVISSDEVWFKFGFASVLAILSKHVIRFQKKHVFNPAAFGIFSSIILFGVSTQWMGTYLWYIVVPFGFYLAYKIRKVELVAGYALAFLVFFGTNAMAQKVPLWNILGYGSYFYIFIMLIEPKTAPVKTAGKYLFGAGAAGLAFVLTQVGARFDVELFSLLMMNLAVVVLNKLPLKKEA